jgi:hypothetical protein
LHFAYHDPCRAFARYTLRVRHRVHEEVSAVVIRVLPVAQLPTEQAFHTAATGRHCSGRAFYVDEFAQKPNSVEAPGAIALFHESGVTLRVPLLTANRPL